ncbi:MAG: YraN family protein [bacterium]|nr:YraN family protein [bacterium]
MTPGLGGEGERIAAEHLEARGYRIVARNVRLGRGGEIDIIAKDGRTIVFVEVKARASRSFGAPLAAVDARKRRRLRLLAEEWLQTAAPNAYARFDVITVERLGPRFTVRHLEGAF